MWASQLSVLDVAHRAVLLDLPGFGAAVDHQVPETLAGFAQAVGETIDANVGRAATVVGHSFGGYVALQLYRDRPELFERLVLVSTRSEADPAEAREKRLATARRLEDPNEHLDLDATVKGLLAPGTWELQGPLVAQVRAMVASAPNATIVRTLRAIAHRPDLTPVLPSIAVPSLAVWGEKDVLIPPERTRALGESIAGAQGVEIPGAGHLSPLETPDRFTEVLRAFLARTTAGWPT